MRSTGAPLRDDAISIDPQGLKGIACRACSRRSFPQRPLCHQAPPPLKTPYTLATVDLDDGVRLLDAAVGDVQIDTEVAVELFPMKSDTSGKPLWWYRFRAGEEKR